MKQERKQKRKKKLIRSFFGLLTIRDMTNASMVKLNSWHQVRITNKQSVLDTILKVVIKIDK